MTGDLVIRTEHLGKKYVIGHETKREPYVALRDVLARATRRAWRKSLDMARGRAIVSGDSTEEFWALKDVSFDVKRGDVVGIIGRNGAGKSTLLKVLSRITEPTEGRVTITGRVASLLEVGTGFHPELTGRENIYLNGGILGMKRAEINRKFDEIVAFAEVERFLDTPVKRYSSGMYVRLAFAVAAHLEPEILVVDEVLAVGDAEFQKRCLGKMSEVASQGRTVLFVSHNMQAIRTLCQKAFILDHGVVTYNGDAEDAVRTYASSGTLSSNSRWTRPRQAPSASVAFEELGLSVVGEQPSLKLLCSICIGTATSRASSFVAVDITDAFGNSIMQALPDASPFIPGVPGRQALSMEIHLPPMIPGTYWLSFWIGAHNTDTYDFVRSALAFDIAASPTPGRTFPHTVDHGYVVPMSTCVLLKAGG